MDASRIPVRFANYPGKVDPVGQIMGPNLFGEHLTAVTAEYDEAAGKTRVGFRYTRKEDVPTNLSEA